MIVYSVMAVLVLDEGELYVDPVEDEKMRWSLNLQFTRAIWPRTCRYIGAVRLPLRSAQNGCPRYISSKAHHFNV